VQTNLVYFDLERMTAAAFVEECRKHALLTDWSGPRRMRFVTHHGVTAEDVQTALKVSEEVLSGSQ
jgi:threonine aldolase